MKMNSFFLGCVVAAGLSTTAPALTVEAQVTPDYVRAHSQEWSVKVSKKENGLIQFTLVRTLAEPRWLVAHLVVQHAGKIIAESDTPTVGHKHDNTFYFAILPEDLAESKFDLSESGFSISGGQVIPIVGSIIHQFRLLEFVPVDLRQRAPTK